MASKEPISASRNPPGWTKYLWAGAAALLAAPFIAMRFTSEVDWHWFDFLIMGILLTLVCGAIELAVRASSNRAFRLGMVIAVGASFLIVWVNLAVGIVGSPDNPANLLFFGVVLLAIGGAALAKLRAEPMALAMTVGGSALLVALVIAKLGPHDEPMASQTAEWVGTSLFAGFYFLSALLFRAASRASE